jgi:hypothetical protein
MKRIACVVLAWMFVGCWTGIRFAPQYPTNDLPDSFKKRVIYPDESGTLKYKLTQLLGRVVYKEPGVDAYDVKRVVLKPGYATALGLISEADGQIFEGLVDKSAGGKGSYLTFSGSLSTKEVATVSIKDRNVVFVNNNDVPWDLLVEEAKSPKNSPATRRYWIQGALLASLDITRFAEIEADAKGVLGPTIGVEGKVYNKQSQAIHDYKISVQLIDLDRLADKAAVHSLLPLSEILKDPSVLKDLQVTGIEILKVHEPK